MNIGNSTQRKSQSDENRTGKDFLRQAHGNLKGAVPNILKKVKY